MEKRLVKFIWGAGDRIKGDWYLGLWGYYDRLPGRRHSGVAISCRGLLRWVAALSVGGYLVAASALAFTFQRNPYNQVGYLDTLLLPVRWQKVREARGRMLIEEGLADLAAKRWTEASMKLRAGLNRAPHDRRARLELARFFVAANRRASALALLTEDLDHGYPGRPFLEVLFALAAEGEDDDRVVSACDRFQAEGPDRVWLEQQKTLALLRAHRFADVLALTPAAGSGSELAGEARVMALLELKGPTDALAELTGWQQRASPNPALILRLQARAWREAERTVEMDAALGQLRQIAGNDPRTCSYIIVQQWLVGRRDVAGLALEEYFRRFAGAANNLAIAVQALGEAKAAPLVQRCAEEAAAHGFVDRPFRLALIQAQLSAGDGAAASRTLGELKKTSAAPVPKEALLLEWMTHLLAVAMQPDEAPPAGLVEFLQQKRVTLRVHRQSGEMLLAAGRFATARQVLEQAERAYPASRSLAELRGRVEQARQSAVVAAPTAAVVAAPVAPGGEKAFFAEIATAQREQRWSDAADALRRIRTVKPEWLGAREGEVFELQLRVAAQQGDVPELLGVAGLYLDGSPARAARGVALAREFGAGGNRPAGRQLLREVLRRHPDYPPAVRLRTEWEPPPTGPNPPGAEAGKPAARSEPGRPGAPAAGGRAEQSGG